MTAETARNVFWGYFDKYLQEHGNEFYVTHIKGGKNQAAGNINNPSPMAQQTICCEYKHLEQVVLVQVYINRKVPLYNALYFRKDMLEEELGYKVEWIDHGVTGPEVRRIQKKFYIDRSLDKMVELVYPYILDFIRVFSEYL